MSSSRPTGSPQDPARSPASQGGVARSPGLRAQASASSSSQPHLSQPPVVVPAPSLPLENRPLCDFSMGEQLPKTSFHEIQKAVDVKTQQSVYLKRNTIGSVLSEIEAAIAAFYRFLAPSQIPITQAVYNDRNETVGVVSYEIPCFQTVAQEPLKEEDLNLDHLNFNDGTLFEVLDKFDKELEEIEADVAQKELEIESALDKVDEQKQFLQSRQQRLQANGIVAPNELKELAAGFRANTEEEARLFEARCTNTERLSTFYNKLFTEHHVTKDDFRKFRIIKGLAIGLTASYIFGEDDLHRNNMSKDGKRIDFDMSLWLILFGLKDMWFVERKLRQPNKNAHNVTERDIVNSPILEDAQPYHWPAKPPGFLQSVAMRSTSGAANAFSKEASAIYHKLAPPKPDEQGVTPLESAATKVYRHYKYATLLKFIISNESIYRNIGLLHIRKDRELESKNAVETLARFQAERIQRFKDVLVRIPEFGEFLKADGDRLLQAMLLEFEEHNKKYLEPIAKLAAEIQALEKRSTCLTEMNMSLEESTQVLSGGETADAVQQEELTHSLVDEPKQLMQSSVITDDYIPDPAGLAAEKAARDFDKIRREENETKFGMISDNKTELRIIASQIKQKTEAKTDYLRQTIHLDTMKTAYAMFYDKCLSPPKTPDVSPVRDRSPSIPALSSSPSSKSSDGSASPVVKPQTPSFLQKKGAGASSGLSSSLILEKPLVISSPPMRAQTPGSSGSARARRDSDASLSASTSLILDRPPNTGLGSQSPALGLMNSVSSFFSAAASKVLPPPPVLSAGKPITFNDVKKVVLAAMTTYKNPGMTNGWGLGALVGVAGERTNLKEAEDIEVFCKTEELTPAENNSEACATAIVLLKKKLNDALQELIQKLTHENRNNKYSEFKNVLQKLLQDPIWSVVEKPNPTLSRSPSLGAVVH